MFALGKLGEEYIETLYYLGFSASLKLAQNLKISLKVSPSTVERIAGMNDPVSIPGSFLPCSF